MGPRRAFVVWLVWMCEGWIMVATAAGCSCSGHHDTAQATDCKSCTDKLYRLQDPHWLSWAHNDGQCSCCLLYSSCSLLPVQYKYKDAEDRLLVEASAASSHKDTEAGDIIQTRICRPKHVVGGHVCTEQSTHGWTNVRKAATAHTHAMASYDTPTVYRRESVWALE